MRRSAAPRPTAPPPLSLLRRTLVVALFATAAAVAYADLTTPASDSPWRLVVELRFADAHAAFADAAEDTAAPADRLGTAVTLLGTQPRTDAKINRAEATFAELSRTADPDIAARAAYLYARIPHLHRPSTDWAEAARRYLAAYEAHPEHPLGQRAFIRYGVVTLARTVDPAALHEPLAAYLTTAAALTDPTALRDLEWLLALLHEHRLADPAATLENVERILASPITLRDPSRLSFLVQAGELARQLDQPERAATHYRAFLATTQRDARTFLVRQRLAELPTSP